MRIAIVVCFVFATACGGNKPAPANTSTGGDKPAPTDTKSGSNATQCCCELPSDPPTFEMHDSTECHEDSHGVCQDSDAKCKK